VIRCSDEVWTRPHWQGLGSKGQVRSEVKAFLIFLIVDLKFKVLVFYFLWNLVRLYTFKCRYKFILALTKLGNPPQLPKFGNIHFCPKAEGALFPLVAKL
jgi:hypothetical protein